jgi:hypothetical protein
MNFFGLLHRIFLMMMILFSPLTVLGLSARRINNRKIRTRDIQQQNNNLWYYTGIQVKKMMHIILKRRYSLAANPGDSIRQSYKIGILWNPIESCREYRREPGDGMAPSSTVSERDRILVLLTYWFNIQTRGTQLISNQSMSTLQ